MSIGTVAVSTVNQGDDIQAEQSFGAAAPAEFLPPPTNYAEQKVVRDQVIRELSGLITQVRLSRKTQEEEWLAALRMHRLVHDGNQGYRGRSQSYLPIWARIESIQVAALSRGLFTSEDVFSVVDAESEDPKASEPTQRYIRWELEQNAKLRSQIKPFLRSFVRYGTGVKKVWYNKPLKNQMKRSGRIVPLNKALGKQSPLVNKMVPDASAAGLRVSPRSLFSWYAYPLHAQSLDECTLVFEDIDVPRAFVEQMLRLNYWADGENRGIGAIMDAYRLRQRAESSDTTAESVGDSPQGQIGTITEVYTMMVLPKSAYTVDEDNLSPVSTKITMAGDVVLEVRRNPNWHQMPPYTMGRNERDTGSLYGGGLARLIAPLQYLCNDFANQTVDVGSYVLNPAWKVVRGLMAGPMLPMAPGRVWAVSDPEAITPVETKVELIQGAQSLLGMWTSMAQDWSGAPALAMGVGGSKSGKTATQSQILQQNMGTANQDVVEDIEQDALLPMLYMTWVNGMQFAEDEILFTVAGEQIRMARNQLAINPTFRWLASSQAQSRAQRVQQLMNLLQSIAPLLPIINQSGYKVDVVALIHRVWNDGLGLRGFEDFITKLTPQEMMQQQQMAMAAQQGSQGQGPVQQPQGQGGDRVRSALEQVFGSEGSPEMVPGEGEAFNDVRQNADEIAGAAGAVR